MFKRKDLQSIDRAYFTVKFAGCYGVTLQSKNTRHCWYITSEEYDEVKTCTIFHTHHENTPMHKHGHGRTLVSCMKQIQSHDTYQLKKDARKKRIRHDRKHQNRAIEVDSLITNF